jgi:hypothetical protein
VDKKKNVSTGPTRPKTCSYCGVKKTKFNIFRKISENKTVNITAYQLIKATKSDDNFFSLASKINIVWMLKTTKTNFGKAIN